MALTSGRIRTIRWRAHRSITGVRVATTLTNSNSGRRPLLLRPVRRESHWTAAMSTVGNIFSPKIAFIFAPSSFHLYFTHHRVKHSVRNQHSPPLPTVPHWITSPEYAGLPIPHQTSKNIDHNGETWVGRWIWNRAE